MAFGYSVEVAKSGYLHMHLMLVIDTKSDDLNPMTVFFHKVVPAILTLEGVNSCNLAPRQQDATYKCRAPYHHDLKLDHEFRDAVLRYSYFAKTNDKAQVRQYFKKAFNTSQIKNNKYYCILGESNMLKINPIHKSHRFTVFNTKALNARYKAARQFKPDAAAIQQFFHFTDSTTNEIVGYYSLSYCSGVIDGVTDLAIELGDFYITDPTQYDNWLDSFYLHLEEQVAHIVSTTNGMDQQPIVNTYCDNPCGQELLDLVVGTVCHDYEITV